MMDDTLSPGVWETVHAALAKLSRPFPAEALALADAHREEVAPHLVAELESLRADPLRADKDDMLHEYAMHLLAWWRDPRGLQPLLALAHMPDRDHLDAVFGDHLTESLGRCLGSMAGGHLPPLMALADDPHADPYARSAALDAMKACVIEGDASPEAMRAYVRDLAERVAAESRAGDDESALLNFVVAQAADLCTTDMLPAIRGWFDEGLLDPLFAGMQDIEETVSQPFDQRLQELRERRKGYIRDPETEMAWWYCFQEPPSRAGAGVPLIDPFPRDRAKGASLLPPAQQTQVRESPKIGRNDPCHCGSGKKYKKCHGAA